jgi:hypothetical protein
MPDPEWRLRREDCAEWRGLETAEGVFNVLHILFTDAETLERRTVTARDDDSIASVGAFERLVRAEHRRMTAAEAQSIADRAVRVLGGGTPGRWFITVSADRSLERVDGKRVPVTEVKVGDRIAPKPVIAPVPLTVFGVSHAPERAEARIGAVFGVRPAGIEPATFRSGGERSIP